jgi:acyl-coenzyme A thioesterase PaaI-like protein
MAPGLQTWNDGDTVRGSVQFDWAYEGPPDHVHGGWVAAVLDHFMGMAQMRSGAPGMTGGLDVRYVKPTPIGKKLDLVATLERVGSRKNRVRAEMSCEGHVTAKADAVFVQPRSAIFTEGLDTLS